MSKRRPRMSAMDAMSIVDDDMPTDIVERLKHHAKFPASPGHFSTELMREAAAEIERLRGIAARRERDAALPRHPFEVTLQIDGEDWEYVLRAVDDLAVHLRDHGPDCKLVSGGGGGSHYVMVLRRDVTPEQFRSELETWFLSGKAAAAAIRANTANTPQPSMGQGLEDSPFFTGKRRGEAIKAEVFAENTPHLHPLERKAWEAVWAWVVYRSNAAAHDAAKAISILITAGTK